MKVSIILLIIFIFLQACSFTYMDDFEFDKVQFDSYDQVMDWVINNVEYVEDNGNVWKKPQITLTQGGDCEDLGILAISIIYYQFGIKGELISIRVTNNSHAIIKVKEQFFFS